LGDGGLPSRALAIDKRVIHLQLQGPQPNEKNSSMKKTIVRSLALSQSLLFLAFLPVKNSLASVPAPKVSWHKSYGGSGEESHPHYVIQTKDRGFLMVGETGFIEDMSARIFVVKTDRLGELIWKKEFGDRGYNLGNCVSEALDGHYLIAGCLNLDAALIKVDAASGKTLWTRTWNLGAEEDVCITKDGGALVANDCGAFGFTKIAKFPKQVK
jgi:hypothetical protein